MTTRAIVPNADGEGSLGTSKAKWGAIYSSSPASGENSGQVPTTAWVQRLVAEALKTAKTEIYKQAKLDAHPVGSYYWSNDSTSPATLFGGTWEALPPGYTLIAQGSGSDSFGSFTYEAGKQYGERKHKLTTDELASHNHVDHIYNKNNENGQSAISGGYLSSAVLNWSDTPFKTAGGSTGDPCGITSSTGGNAAHNNLQPSVGAYCWKRTA